MSDDLGPDLDQLLPQSLKRPMFHRIGLGQRPHEVGCIHQYTSFVEKHYTVIRLWLQERRLPAFFRTNGETYTPKA